MMITIKCPKCGTDGSMSLVQRTYEGPYRCWKCRELFSIKIEGNEVKYLEPLPEEALKAAQGKSRQMEELKAKFRKP